MDEPGSPDPYIVVKKDHKQRGEDVAVTRGRIPKDMSLRERTERKFWTKVGKSLYRLRGQIAEAPYGQIKDCLNLEKFLLRGPERVGGAFDLWCSTHNALKLYRLVWWPPRVKEERIIVKNCLLQ